MDRNSVIGLLLIAGILIGFSIYNSPNKEQLALQKRHQDSLAIVAKQNEAALAAKKSVKANEVAQVISDTAVSDSIRMSLLSSKYGAFAGTAAMESKKIVMENELIKVELDSKGGRIASVELKNYMSYFGTPLKMFNPDSSGFGVSFNYLGRNYVTDSLNFIPSGASFQVKDNDSSSISMRLPAGENKYIEFLYSLKGNSYTVGCEVNMIGFEQQLGKDVDLNWWMNTPHIEKSFENQRNSTTIYYKFKEDEIDYISERSEERLPLTENVKWIGFKQQFFTSVMIAPDGFSKGATIETKQFEENKDYVKKLSAEVSLDNKKGNISYPLTFYFGPNHYQTLKKYDISLEKQIPLGWGIFGWVNRFCVIPVFNFLNSFDINYGIIILILTVLIKLVLFPLTYKAYLSTAKMRVLKPEMDEINKKHEKDDPLKKQQAVMELYRKAGVNPMGGCLPMLLQMPILIAMFNFFPASIELRQEKFLWADDLSTYDSIYNLGFNIPFYGDHISLFTLLMTVSTILYTRMSNSQMGDNPQMAQMKWIMYLMPIIFLGVFNNYSAGLSYYYFLANMITFGQQFFMRKLVDEDAIHRKIQENKKNPVTKGKSTFQLKLEEMAKKQQQRKK